MRGLWAMSVLMDLFIKVKNNMSIRQMGYGGDFIQRFWGKQYNG